MVNVYVFKASEGDCLWIHYENESSTGNIIVDGGIASTGAQIKKIIEICDINNESIDAIIATHVDEDHIAGIISGLSTVKKDVLQRRIDKILFNTKEGFLKSVGDTSLKISSVMNEITYKNPEDYIQVNVEDGVGCSIGDAKSLRRVITEKELDDRLIDYVVSGLSYKIKGARISIISPDQKALGKFMNEWKSEKEEPANQGCSLDFPVDLEINLEDLKNKKFASADQSLLSLIHI